MPRFFFFFKVIYVGCSQKQILSLFGIWNSSISCQGRNTVVSFTHLGCRWWWVIQDVSETPSLVSFFSGSKVSRVCVMNENSKAEVPLPHPIGTSSAMKMCPHYGGCRRCHLVPISGHRHLCPLCAVLHLKISVTKNGLGVGVPEVACRQPRLLSLGKSWSHPELHVPKLKLCIKCSQWHLAL